ncbi:MAG: hypothetical protein ACMUIP_17590 [bacterium]
MKKRIGEGVRMGDKEYGIKRWEGIKGKIWQGIKGVLHEKVVSYWGKDFGMGARGMRTGRVFFAGALLRHHTVARGLPGKCGILQRVYDASDVTLAHLSRITMMNNTSCALFASSFIRLLLSLYVDLITILSAILLQVKLSRILLSLTRCWVIMTNFKGYYSLSQRPGFISARAAHC